MADVVSPPSILHHPPASSLCAKPKALLWVPVSSCISHSLGPGVPRRRSSQEAERKLLSLPEEAGEYFIQCKGVEFLQPPPANAT